MTKPTTGPWRVGDAGFTIFGPPNGTPAPEIIASVKKKQNSRVLAAAPELLEALKQLRDAMIRYMAGSETHLYEVTQANAVIAKAESQS